VSDGWPDRTAVDEAWRDVLSGARSREDVRDWTVPWVEGQLGVGRASDLMVSNGLQYLHGLGLSNRSPDGLRAYMFDDDDAAARYKAWQVRCLEYDLDPAGWSERQIALAKQRIAEERREASE